MTDNNEYRIMPLCSEWVDIRKGRAILDSWSGLPEGCGPQAVTISKRVRPDNGLHHDYELSQDLPVD